MPFSLIIATALRPRTGRTLLTMTSCVVAVAVRVIVGNRDADRADVAGRVVAGCEAIIEVLVLDAEAHLTGRRVDRCDREDGAVGGRIERVADRERGHAGRVADGGDANVESAALFGSPQSTVSVCWSKRPISV